MVKLFVGNLTPKVTSDELKQLFEQHGKVSECEIIRNYGFVHMDDPEEAEKAFNALNNYTLQGRALHIEYSTSKLRKAPGMDDVCFRCGAGDHKTHDCPLHDGAKPLGGGGKRPAPRDEYNRPPKRPNPPDSFYGGRANDYGRYRGGGGYAERFTPPLPRAPVMYDYFDRSAPASGQYEDPLIPKPHDRLLTPLYEEYLNARERYYYYRDRLERELFAMRRAGAAPVAPAPPPPPSARGAGYGSMVGSSNGLPAASGLDSFGSSHSPPTSLVRYPELYYARTGNSVSGAPIKYDYDHYSSAAAPVSSGSGFSSSVSTGRSLYDPYP